MGKSLILICLLAGSSLLYPQQETTKNITLCWDTSASMAARDLGKEFGLLGKLFDRYPNVGVQLLLFNVSIKEKNYQVRNGDWTRLQSDLQQQVYDGGTFYGLLEHKIANAEAYIFTDGNKLFEDDLIPLGENGTLVNSCPDHNLKFLERTALLNRGKLIDFAAMLPQSIEQVGRQDSSDNADAQLLKGTVYVDNRPIENAEVRIKGGTGFYRTDANGVFEVPATVGDSLIVSGAGTGTPQMVTVEAMAHTKVFLDDGTVQLEEVIVEEKRIASKETVNTAYGEVNKESLGYAVSSVGEDDINDSEAKLHEALDGKVSGMNITKASGWDNRSTLGKTLIRGMNSINMNNYALMVIDGIPVESSIRQDPFGAQLSNQGMTRAIGSSTVEAQMDYINPDNIESVTVLKGLAATNRFGAMGANGVIMITTKTAAFKGKKGKKKDNPALLRNNIYDAKGFSMPSAFFKALQDSGGVDEAYQTYLSLRDLNAGDAGLYLDAFAYFKDKNPERAKRAITNLVEDSPGDLAALSMAMLCVSALEAPKLSERLAVAITRLDPSNVNARYTLAKAPLKAHHYGEALKSLTTLLSGRGFGSVDASGIAKTLERDIKNMVNRYGEKLPINTLDAKYRKNISLGARLVFEWNDPGQQFEIQFVNPQQRYFNWEYSNAADRQRMTDGLKKNYALEEFEMFTSDKGKWVVNARYLGHVDPKSETPLVLKCTVYHDFGLPAQRKEHIVLHFDKAGQKKSVKTIFID